MITVRVDDRLHVLKDELPPGHEAQIKQYLTVRNGAKEAAQKRRQWGWQDLPDSFYLYEDDSPWLHLPRGFASVLREALTAGSYPVNWDDHTSEPELELEETVFRGPRLHPDQEAACQALLREQQGVVEAPTGSGKTVLVLEAWRRSQTRGLILVEKAALAGQWRERAREHLGVEAGMIGEGEWEERPLTIAMMQTLRSRGVKHDFWQRWGFTVCDEAHHLRAETYGELVKHVCSRYRVGVTATPLGGMWEQPFLTNVLGPIIHVTTPETLRRAGRRVTPVVRRVHTGWSWERQNARERALVDTKVIYRRVIDALQDDAERVRLVARTFAAQPDSCAQLVIARRLAYLDHVLLALEEVSYSGDVLMMRGQDDSLPVFQRVEDGGCVVLATVADEAVDMPRLDRLHLPWPQRQELTLTQQVGRVVRTHPEKRETVIYDYVDAEGMLIAQANARARVYRKLGYAIENAEVLA